MERLKTDSELLAAYKDGDNMAFERLYQRHKRRLQAKAKEMMSDDRRTEDVLVEAMQAVAAAARRGAIQGSFLGYALTAVHHRAQHVLDRMRERSGAVSINP